MIKLVILCMLLLNNVYAAETPAKVSVDGSNKVTGTLNINDAIELGSNGSITAASGTFNSLSATDITGVTNISASSITISTIDVTSSFRLSPGAGVDKLLISDADGYASWFTPPNFAILDATQTFTGENTFTYVKADLVHANNIGRTEGLISTPTITADGTATISITSVPVLIRDTSYFTGNIVYATVPAVSNFALTDNSINFIYVDYNSGSPVYKAATTDTLSNSANYLRVARLFIKSGAIEYLFYNGANALGNPSKNYERVMRARGINGMEIESGFTLTETTGRIINIAAGVFWFGLDRFSIGAQNSFTSTCHYYTHDSGGNWIETSTQAYINDVYDTNTGTQPLTTNRYAVNYIYGNGKTGEIDIYLGRGNYTASQAAAAATTLPSVAPQTNWFYLPLGSIVVLKNASTATTIYQITKTAFTANTNTIDASQVVSGTLDSARLPNIPPALVDLSTVTTAIALKADIAGQVFTGDITAPNIMSTGEIITSSLTVNNELIYTDGNNAPGKILMDVSGDGSATWQPIPVGAQSVYYLTATNSDISGYKVLDTSISSTVAVTTTTWSALTDGTNISTYATNVGYPGAQRTPAGVWTFSAWLSKSVDTKVLALYAKVYRRDSLGTETLLLTSGNSVEVTGTTPTRYSFTGITTNNIDWVASDRLVIRYFVSVTGTGSAPTMEAYKGGTYYEEVLMPATVVNAASYVVKDSSGDVNLDGGDLKVTDINALGQITTASTMTVMGSAFSVGGSTLTIANGKVGVGMAPDTGVLTALGVIKSSGAASSFMFGDRGNSAHSFEWYSSGDIARLYSSVSAKDVAKISSLGALETSAGLVVTGEINHKGGAGIFISSSSTNWNFPNVNIARGAGGVDTLAKYLNFTFPGDDVGSTTPGKEWAFWLAMSSFTATSQSDSSTNMSLMGPGKLGIGTTSPSYNLDVYGSGAALRVNGNATPSHLYMAKSGTNYAQLAVDGTDTYFDYGGSIGRLWFRAGVEGTTKASIDASGNLALSGGIVGKTDGTTPATGMVGEYISVTAGPINFAASGEFGTIASLTLSTGTWMINGELTARVSGSTTTGIFSVWLDTGNDLTIGKDYLPIPNTAAEGSATVAGYRLVLTSNRTIYLKGRAYYSAGQPDAYGTINVERR